MMGTNATHGMNQFLYDTLPFDAEKDFEPIILVGIAADGDRGQSRRFPATRSAT